ncbi:cation transporter [Acidobacteria bacterium AH-259-O06]|nr:cation transporter [Acidobacteria bacterium AH-259-O06]
MKRLVCAVSLIVGMVLLALPTTAAEPAAETEIIKGTIEGKVLCKLDGTASGCCIGKLEKGIASVKGVKEVHINAKAGTASIALKKGAKVSVKDIKKAVANADKGHNHGFKVTEIKQAE